MQAVYKGENPQILSLKIKCPFISPKIKIDIKVIPNETRKKPADKVLKHLFKACSWHMHTTSFVTSESEPIQSELLQQPSWKLRVITDAILFG